MENKTAYFYIAEGVLRSFFLTLGFILIYAVMTTYLSIGVSIRSICMVVFTCLSIMYGAAYAARKVQKSGWLIGVLVALSYILVFYIVSIAAGREVAVGFKDLIRVIIGLFVGLLSGMMGVNM